MKCAVAVEEAQTIISLLLTKETTFISVLLILLLDKDQNIVRTLPLPLDKIDLKAYIP
jgi:hypothetical protein